MADVLIDLDTPPPRISGPRRPSRLPRVVAAGVFALLAAAPQAPPPVRTVARPLPLPSYCTGAPMPGGRLDIVRDGSYIILDGPSKVVISSGPCRHS